MQAILRAAERAERQRQNSLAVRHPDVAALWHSTKNGDLTPSDVSRGSALKVWWQCTKDPAHEWCATPNAMTAPQSLGRGCKHCDKLRRKVSVTAVNAVNVSQCRKQRAYSAQYKYQWKNDTTERRSLLDWDS